MKTARSLADRAQSSSARRLWFLLQAAFLLSTSCLVHAVSLSDFGYEHMNVNGTLALGTRPLLVILVNFDGQPPLPQSPVYYENLVFNTAQFPSFNGYFEAVSDSAFSFSLGGVIEISLPASETFTNYQTPTTPPFVGDSEYCSNIISHAMTSVFLAFRRMTTIIMGTFPKMSWE